MSDSGPRGASLVLLALVLLLGPAVPARAHDVPADVLVRMLLKADGARLRILIRVPLVAMQDIDFPQHGPGYLNIPDAEPTLRQSVDSWIGGGFGVYENGVRLQGQRVVTVMASLPSDRSFATFDQALAHLRGPRLPDATDIVWQQAMLDVLFEYAIQSDRSDFAIDPKLARLGLQTRTAMQFELPDGTVRGFEYHGNPGLVHLDPRWNQAARQFAGIGFWHILDGLEHLLFLACLVMAIRRFRPLVASVTSFAIGHTLTLTTATLGFVPDVLWFPTLINALIALSIVYLAFENALSAQPKRRWLVAFTFGLVHGYAFAFALRETLPFAGGHGLISMIAFNAGIELGQLVVVVAMVAVMSALFRVALPARAGTILLSGLVAHTAWHWMLTRGAALRLYDISLMPLAFDQRFLGDAMRWATLGAIVVALLWLMSMVFPKLEQQDSGS